ncbi:MAG: PH domain-containing protein [Streptosporangiales bacterium]|nr:PH domain-containing protein [Streptosporangiales bacterium]MBO0891959.1 PH domain-containing protein [Acidothermales bacterium]
MSTPSAEDRLDEKSRAGWILGWLWMVFALYNVVDILRHPWDRASAYAGSILLLVTGVVYVIALRPRLRADRERVLIRNPLHDVEIPWGAVTEVAAHDTVRVDTEHKRYHSWVGHVPNRRRARFDRSRLRARAAELSADPRGRGFDQSSGANARTEVEKMSQAEFMVQRLRDLSGRFGPASRDAGHTTVSVRWSWPALAALAFPALLIVASAVIP